MQGINVLKASLIDLLNRHYEAQEDEGWEEDEEGAKRPMAPPYISQD